MPNLVNNGLVFFNADLWYVSIVAILDLRNFDDFIIVCFSVFVPKLRCTYDVLDVLNTKKTLTCYIALKALY